MVYHLHVSFPFLVCLFAFLVKSDNPLLSTLLTSLQLVSPPPASVSVCVHVMGRN